MGVVKAYRERKERKFQAKKQAFVKKAKAAKEAEDRVAGIEAQSTEKDPVKRSQNKALAQSGSTDNILSRSIDALHAFGTHQDDASLARFRKISGQVDERGSSDLWHEGESTKKIAKLQNDSYVNKQSLGYKLRMKRYQTVGRVKNFFQSNRTARGE